MPIAIHDDVQATPASSDPFPSLDHFKVQGIPPAAFYVPDFITEEEEEFLIRKIQESPQPKWKTVGTGRRLQYWGGNMSKKGILLPEAFPDWLASFPNILERIESFLGNARFNQVLINEYQPEQGISPHEDGAAFKPLVATLSLGSHTVLDIHHYASTLSPSPPMTATETDDPTPRIIAATPLAHLLVLPRSLLVLSSTLYTSHLHGIRAQARDEVHQGEGPGDRIVNADQLGSADIADALSAGGWSGDRGVRTSLTFRTANKVVKGDLLRGVIKK